MANAAPILRLGRRERTKARNRAVLLAAARAVFGRQGYDGATVRDIVRATDLSVGTFYQYFRDKEEIFAAVVEEVFRGLRQRLRAVRRDRTMSLPERIYQAYLAFFTFVVEERSLFEILERHVWTLGRDPEQESLAASLREVEEDLYADVEAGQIIAAPPDYLAAATVGIAMTVAQRMLLRAQPDPQEAARLCTDIVVRGVTHASTLPAARAGGPAPQPPLRIARKGPSERATGRRTQEREKP